MASTLSRATLGTPFKATSQKVDNTAPVPTRDIPSSILVMTHKLEELSSLNDNWDSYGAKRPSQSALLGAMRWASELFSPFTPDPDVFPMANGNVQLEWSQHGMDIELEISSISTCIAYVCDLRTQDEWEDKFIYDITRLARVVTELSDRNKQRHQQAAIRH